MKKMLFIYNPNSGMGLLKPKLSDVLDIFVKGGYAGSCRYRCEWSAVCV